MNRRWRGGSQDPEDPGRANPHRELSKDKEQEEESEARLPLPTV